MSSGMFWSSYEFFGVLLFLADTTNFSVFFCVSCPKGDTVSVKVKITPWHAYAGAMRRRRYSSNPFATSALEGLVAQHHALAALPLGKTRYSLYRMLGRPWGRSGRARKISFPPEFDLRTVQSVASHYTGRPIYVSNEVNSLTNVTSFFIILW